MNRPAPLYGKKKRSAGTIAANIFSILAACLILLLCLNAYMGRRYTVLGVSGRSMQNTFQNGDYLYTDARLTATRGDVVIVDVTPYPDKYPRDEKQTEYLIIKRLVATEGDSVYCKDGVVYLKKSGEAEFSALDEDYVYFQSMPKDFGGVLGGRPNEVKKNHLGNYGVLDYDEQGNVVPITVGKGEIFFLGDHRDNSTDSRDVGCLKKTDIIAVVPDWAIRLKWYSTGVETFREKVLEFFGF